MRSPAALVRLSTVFLFLVLLLPSSPEPASAVTYTRLNVALTDQTGQPVSGVTFTLLADNGARVPDNVQVTQQDGWVTFNYVPDGSTITLDSPDEPPPGSEFRVTGTETSGSTSPDPPLIFPFRYDPEAGISRNVYVQQSVVDAAPTPTPTIIPPTNTLVPTATATPTPTNTPIPTATATPTPTNTPIPTATATSTPTNTPIPTATATSTPISAPTSIPTQTVMPVPTSTATPAQGSTDIATPTALPTEIPTATSVPAQTPTATVTPAPVPTDTLPPTAIATQAPTATPTATPFNTLTATTTPTWTPPPAQVVISTEIATSVSTATQTAAATSTPTPTIALEPPTNIATTIPTVSPIAPGPPTASPIGAIATSTAVSTTAAATTTPEPETATATSELATTPTITSRTPTPSVTPVATTVIDPTAPTAPSEPVTPPLLSMLSLSYLDGTGQGVSGAWFRLDAADCRSPFRPARMTNASGQTRFSGVPRGTYCLVESRAATGYVQSAPQILLVEHDQMPLMLTAVRLAASLPESPNGRLDHPSTLPTGPEVTSEFVVAPLEHQPLALVHRLPATGTGHRTHVREHTDRRTFVLVVAATVPFILTTKQRRGACSRRLNHRPGQPSYTSPTNDG